MPSPASPFNAVPNGISYPASSPDPRSALMALMGGQAGQGSPQGMPGQGPPGAGGPPSPPPMDVSPPSGPLSSPNAVDPNAVPPADDQDLFQRVVSLLMDPSTKQMNPEMLLLFAGIGAAHALEKTGKYKTNPHRSNAENAAAGYMPGNPGQTGLPSPDQMQQSTAAPTPPGMPGF